MWDIRAHFKYLLIYVIHDQDFIIEMLWGSLFVHLMIYFYTTDHNFFLSIARHLGAALTETHVFLFLSVA